MTLISIKTINQVERDYIIFFLALAYLGFFTFYYFMVYSNRKCYDTVNKYNDESKLKKNNRENSGCTFNYNPTDNSCYELGFRVK
jgi:hypothetical protein